MQAFAQPSRLGLKRTLQLKARSTRYGKPILNVTRGSLQSQAAIGISGPLLAPNALFQLAEVETPAAPVLLDVVVDAPPPLALDAVVAATEALSASAAAPEAQVDTVPNAVEMAVEAVTETVSDVATAAISAATDVVSAATDVVSAVADAVTDAVMDATDAAAEAVSSSATTASETVTTVVAAAKDAAVTTPPSASPAPQSLSLAAQRYAEMTSKTPKLAPSGGGGGAADFQTPSFSLPDFSGGQLPKLSAPDLSKLSFPELPKLPAASGDAMSLPSVDFGSLDLPAAPALNLPDVSSTAATVSGAAASAVANATAAASNALSGVTDAVGGAASTAAAAVVSAADTAAATVNGATGGLLDELDRELGSVRSAAESVTTAVESTFVRGVVSVQSSVGGAVGQTYDALPPQVQVIAGDLGDLLFAFTSHPMSSLVLAGLVGLPLWVRSLVNRYGGYSGDLTPATVKELLGREDVLVVDVRTEAERQESGVLDLRKSARFSAAALPADVVTFSPKWARESNTGERLASLTTALLISGLNRIRTPLTKVVIMSNNDDVAARELARAVRAAGVLRVYVMVGGFKAWQAAGLGVTQGKTDYDASVLVVLLDEVAELAAIAGTKLREPAFVATSLATSSLVIYGAINYHTTLRYFAVWGIFATLYWRLSRYNSPQEFLSDVKSGVVAAASSAAGAAAAAASAAASRPAAATLAPAVAPLALRAPAPTPVPRPVPTPAASSPSPSPSLAPLPQPTEALPAALAAAMAAAGVAPLPPPPPAPADSPASSEDVKAETEVPSPPPPATASATAAANSQDQDVSSPVLPQSVAESDTANPAVEPSASAPATGAPAVAVAHSAATSIPTSVPAATAASPSLSSTNGNGSAKTEAAPPVVQAVRESELPVKVMVAMTPSTQDSPPAAEAASDVAAADEPVAEVASVESTSSE